MPKNKNNVMFRTKRDGEETRAMMMDFIVTYWLKKLRPPRYREIGDSLGMSTSHVRHHLAYLEHQGKILWHQYQIENKDDWRRVDIIPVGLKVSYESPQNTD